jgi:hypothetical protein
MKTYYTERMEGKGPQGAPHRMGVHCARTETLRVYEECHQGKAEGYIDRGRPRGKYTYQINREKGARGELQGNKGISIEKGCSHPISGLKDEI